MRTIRIVIAGLVLSLAAITTVSASPFTAIGLPLVYGQEAPPPVQSPQPPESAQPTNWWVSVVQTAFEQLRVLTTHRVIVEETTPSR